MDGALSEENLWNKSVPRVELDRRARDARLRLERIERLLVPCVAAVTDSWLRQVLYLFSAGRYGEGPQSHRTRRPLSNGGLPACLKFTRAGSKYAVRLSRLRASAPPRFHWVNIGDGHVHSLRLL
jgi:hypothetical protein